MTRKIEFVPRSAFHEHTLSCSWWSRRPCSLAVDFIRNRRRVWHTLNDVSQCLLLMWIYKATVNGVRLISHLKNCCWHHLQRTSTMFYFWCHLCYKAYDSLFYSPLHHPIVYSNRVNSWPSLNISRDNIYDRGLFSCSYFQHAALIGLSRQNQQQ